jgi:hypothetical protein
MHKINLFPVSRPGLSKQALQRAVRHSLPRITREYCRTHLSQSAMAGPVLSTGFLACKGGKRGPDKTYHQVEKTGRPDSEDTAFRTTMAENDEG